MNRPPGEWIFLALLFLAATDSLYNGVTADLIGGWGTSVWIGNVVLGLLTLGVAAAIVARGAWGLPLLRLYPVALVYTGSAAAWKVGGAPLGAVLGTAVALAIISAAVIWYATRRLHAGVTQRMWPVLVARHAAAVEEYVAAISAMELATWTVRRTPDAWSAAEITEHLSRTYAQFGGEARGQSPLRIRLGLVQRTMARLFVKPGLLDGRPFPRAKAPRELRPTRAPATPTDGVVMFRAAGDACLLDLEIVVMRRPYVRMVHPYLGALPLYEIMQLAILHIGHHRRQLSLQEDR